jgi:hypothetical protein
MHLVFLRTTFERRERGRREEERRKNKGEGERMT